MNILVVSEAFTKGGLENHIQTYYNNIKHAKMIFAFGRYESHIDLGKAKIYTGFHFSYSDSISQFCEDVDRLIDIIKNEKIDVVHAHPYYSFFASYIAAICTNTKFVYTYHGYGSFNFPRAFIDSILFQYAFESHSVSNVFCVNDLGCNAFKNIGYDNFSLLPNPVNLKDIKVHKYEKNGKWALVSRLDDDKKDEIKEIINNYRFLGIRQIDIYGSGSAEDELKQLVTSLDISDINFMGYENNINSKLVGYNGVIGIGRVVLEALSMKLPTLLIGYGMISGIVNLTRFLQIKDSNFINTNIIPDDLEQIKKDIKKLDDLQNDIDVIYDVLKDEFDTKIVINKYMNLLNKNTQMYPQNIKSLYREIKLLSENDDIKNCAFYKENLILELLVKYVKRYTLNVNILNLFSSAALVNENVNLILLKNNELRMEMKTNEEN